MICAFLSFQPTASVSYNHLGRFCGRRMNCYTNSASNSVLYTSYVPFVVQVDFNGAEATADNKNRGFSVDYRQIKCWEVLNWFHLHSNIFILGTVTGWEELNLEISTFSHNKIMSSWSVILSSWIRWHVWHGFFKYSSSQHTPTHTTKIFLQ